ncbi:hypothetical protein MMC19_004285 [Ptychographa xylographoides]|nr:hypothetical protein [Ptychographa xylographoides]
MRDARATNASPLAVSWNYGGGKPSGEVAEKKTDGEVTVTSKKGNTIKRKGEPENPAVHIAREPNDVVKKQSELTVEEKADGDVNGEAGEDDVEEDEEEEEEEEAKTGTKRKATDDDFDQDEEAGKDVKRARGRPKGITKATPVKKVGGTGKRGRPAKPKVEGVAPAAKVSDGPKKGRGRPKKEVNGAAPAAPASKSPKAKKAAASPKKEKKPAAKPTGTGVGSRTRSRN